MRLERARLLFGIEPCCLELTQVLDYSVSWLLSKVDDEISDLSDIFKVDEFIQTVVAGVSADCSIADNGNAVFGEEASVVST